ncbi:MAG: peptidoglycan-binding protein [Pseudomonadota bacterium]
MSSARPVLRRGSRGPAVSQLQVLLNAHHPGVAVVAVDESFGRRTENAVKVFQRSRSLRVDGEVGTDTWRELESLDNVETLYQYTPGPQEPLADIAVPYIGATEAHGNRMGSDPRMREIFEADHYAPGGRTDGYAWCSAFVSLCVQKLIDQSVYHGHVQKPSTPSVYNFRRRWAPGQNCLVFRLDDENYSAHKGDIVVFTFSHIGIVESVNENGSLNTIEGNTSVEGSREGTTVRRQVRVKGVIRCLIRLPVPRDREAEAEVCTPEGWSSWGPGFLEHLFSVPELPAWFTYRTPGSEASGAGLVGSSGGRRPGPTGQ